jgi:hypothetical protein
MNKIDPPPPPRIIILGAGSRLFVTYYNYHLTLAMTHRTGKIYLKKGLIGFFLIVFWFFFTVEFGHFFITNFWEKTFFSPKICDKKVIKFCGKKQQVAPCFGGYIFSIPGNEKKNVFQVFSIFFFII